MEYLVWQLATGWMVSDSHPSTGKSLSVLQNCADRPWGTSVLLFNWYWVSFPGLKQLEHEVDHSNPSSA